MNDHPKDLAGDSTGSARESERKHQFQLGLDSFRKSKKAEEVFALLFAKRILNTIENPVTLIESG